MSAIGIDTGGTFCDLVHVASSGEVSVHKSPSTPADTARGVIDVVVVAAAASGGGTEFLAGIGSMAVGTTIATNTVVTRSGAKVGLLATRGHADCLSIMRVNGRVAGRPLHEIQNYSVTDKPAPLVARQWIREIDERIDSAGDVVVPLDVAQVLTAVDELIASGIETLAISFLWSFVNPAHEQAALAALRLHRPELNISLASTLSKRLGEYERTEAAVINAYVAPAMNRYVEQVGTRLRARGLASPLLVMHSVGGLGTEAHTQERPISTLFSGPAGGVIAAQRVAKAAGFENVICADVGGTTFDVGLVVDGRPLLRGTSIIDQRIMFAPTIDIVSIGAGGGSMARVDRTSGRLAVGPDSAGANPGPVCYGRGGSLPTITDANLLLGFMDPDNFLGGRLRLDRAKALAAMQTEVAGPLGIDPIVAAAGIFSIANAKMADLVRKVTVERGYDPRDFVLCAYGGLGPLHAPFYAGDLQVKAVMVPLGDISSVFSAFGIAMSDILHVYEESKLLREPFADTELEAAFAALTEEAIAQLNADGIAEPGRRSLTRFLEMRYVGQLNGLFIELPDGLDDATARGLRARFEAQYLEAFGPGAAWAAAPVEIVACRLEAVGHRDTIALKRYAPESRAPHLTSRRSVYWPTQSRHLDTPIYEGRSVGPGGQVVGPAILEYPTTTILIPPHWSCAPDSMGNLMLAAANT